MSTVAARVDRYGNPAWIVLTVLAFIVWWPLGLAVLAYLLWSGRMGCWRRGGLSHRYEKWSEKSPIEGWWPGAPRSTGNQAFDEYRAETLRRLEEEYQDFQRFLERLRFAKDKQEFDQFMAERRRTSEGPAATQP